MEKAYSFIESKTIELAPGLIPEWENPKEIVMVWPERLRAGVGKLRSFYKTLINTITPHCNVRILAYPDLDKDIILSSFDQQEKVKITHMHVSDINVKDYMPLPQRPVSGNSVVKLLYSPSYLKDKNEIYAAEGNNAAILISDLFDYTIDIPKNEFGLPLILDGGNIILNGRDTAICTNRIMSDNESWSIDQIVDVFNRRFGISNLILMPVIPGDVKGHINSQVRFIDSNNVIVGSFREGYISDFMDNAAERLSRLGLEVHRVENILPEFKSGNRFQSVSGNFVNFLRMGDTLILPEYRGLEKEFKKAAGVYENLGLKIQGVPADDPGETGYGLNAICWNRY